MSDAAADLDPDRVRSLARDRGLPWQDLTVVTRTGSTNADLLDRVAAGSAREGTVIVAAAQDAARGRHGRTWVSPPGGSLSFSVALRPPVARSGFVPALTALAVARAVREVAGVEASLKWPNDIMVGDGKVAGILAEGGDGSVVVGCGINVGLTAEELPVPTATSLALHGADVDRAELLVAALLHLQAGNERWQEAGYDAVGSGLLDAYRMACTTIGREVRVDLPDGTSQVGIAEGVDDEARLVVSGPDGSQTLTAGDVVHLRVP